MLLVQLIRRATAGEGSLLQLASSMWGHGSSSSGGRCGDISSSGSRGGDVSTSSGSSSSGAAHLDVRGGGAQQVVHGQPLPCARRQHGAQACNNQPLLPSGRNGATSNWSRRCRGAGLPLLAMVGTLCQPTTIRTCGMQVSQAAAQPPQAPSRPRAAVHTPTLLTFSHSSSLLPTREYVLPPVSSNQCRARP